jgi:hypothetical protein
MNFAATSMNKMLSKMSAGTLHSEVYVRGHRERFILGRTSMSKIEGGY